MHVKKTVASEKGKLLTAPSKTRISGSERNTESQKKHLQLGHDAALCSPLEATHRTGSGSWAGSIPRPRCSPSPRVSLGPALHAVPEHPPQLLGTAGLPPHLPRSHARPQLRPSLPGQAPLLGHAPLMLSKLIRTS